MQRYEGLDALRGVAAILVMFLHYALYPGIPLPVSASLAVDVFFALSGFVIAANYEHRLQSGMSVADFTLKRLIRFYPVYIAGSIIALFSILLMSVFGNLGVGVDINFWNIFPNMFMLPSMQPSSPGTQVFVINIVAWSLFLEIVVNIIYAVLLCRRSNATLLAVVWVSLAFLVAGIIRNGAFGGESWGTFWNGFFRAMFAFFAGVLIFRLRGAMGQAPTWVVACSPLFLVALAAYSPPEAYEALYNILAVAFFIPLLVIIVTGQQDFPIFPKFFWFLAYISYALYVVHVPIHRIASGVYTRTVEGNLILSVIFGFSICGLAILVAYLATRLDDQLRGWLSARRRALPSSV